MKLIKVCTLLCPQVYLFYFVCLLIFLLLYNIYFYCYSQSLDGCNIFVLVDKNVPDLKTMKNGTEKYVGFYMRKVPNGSFINKKHSVDA